MRKEKNTNVGIGNKISHDIYNYYGIGTEAFNSKMDELMASLQDVLNGNSELKEVLNGRNDKLEGLLHRVIDLATFNMSAVENTRGDISDLSKVVKSNFEKLSALTDKNFQHIVEKIKECHSADALQKCLEEQTAEIDIQFKNLYEQNKGIYDKLVQIAEAIKSGFSEYSTDKQKLGNLHKRLKRLIGCTDTGVYLDSDDILECCKNILAIDSDDRLALFVELATKESNVVRNVICFLDERLKDVGFFCLANKEYIRVIIRYLIRTGEEPILKKLKNFIGKCEPIFSSEPDEIDGYKTEIEELIPRLSGNEYYNSSIDRAAFIICANEDILEVDKLAKELEGKDLRCYYTARNLRNGRNAAANYAKEIKNAIAHCDCTVFVSSKNSRTNVNTIKERGWSNELKPGAPHFEYLIEGYPEIKTPGDILWQAYFNGNHWRTKGQFAELHDDIVKGVAEYKNVRASTVKYCKNCGKQFDIRDVICSYCKCDEFVATYEEYVDIKNKAEYQSKYQKWLAEKEEENRKLRDKNKELQLQLQETKQRFVDRVKTITVDENILKGQAMPKNISDKINKIFSLLGKFDVDNISNYILCQLVKVFDDIDTNIIDNITYKIDINNEAVSELNEKIDKFYDIIDELNKYINKMNLQIEEIWQILKASK